MLDRIVGWQARRGGRRADPKRLAIAICGDIVSNTGYARAARALARLLAENHQVYGVSLQEDPKDRSARFPGKLIQEKDIAALTTSHRVVALHHATPDHFTIYPGAINIGAFYWETPSIPRLMRWPERMAAMDALWLPTSFVRQIALDHGFAGAHCVLPWPHDFDTPPPSSLGWRRHKAWLFDEMPEDGDRGSSIAPVSLADLFRPESDVILAIQSLAPRKGLPLLLSGWQQFIAHRPETPARLLLKLNFRHAHGIADGARQHVRNMLRELGVAPGDHLRIAVLDASLDDDELHGLLRASQLYVSATLGEGFGGPIVEALANDVPVAVPRHTGIVDLLPADYPLQIGYRRHAIGLIDNLDIYPTTATWSVPDTRSIAAVLSRFDDMRRADRRAAAGRAKDHARSFCGIHEVRGRLAQEMARIDAVYS